MKLADSEKYVSLLNAEISEAVEGMDDASTPRCLIIGAKHLHAVCELLHAHKECYMDMLSCVTGLDNGPEAGTMEVIYHLYSIPHDESLAIKVVLDRQAPIVESVVDIWATANWLERETYDLLGIRFSNHPDMRRILLPNDWEGHPLRKDYEAQEAYHGLTVKYDRDVDESNPDRR